MDSIPLIVIAESNDFEFKDGRSQSLVCYFKFGINGYCDE